MPYERRLEILEVKIDNIKNMLAATEHVTDEEMKTFLVEIIILQTTYMDLARSHFDEQSKNVG